MSAVPPINYHWSFVACSSVSHTPARSLSLTLTLTTTQCRPHLDARDRQTQRAQNQEIMQRHQFEIEVRDSHDGTV